MTVKHLMDFKRLDSMARSTTPGKRDLGVAVSKMELGALGECSLPGFCTTEQNLTRVEALNSNHLEDYSKERRKGIEQY